jgi:hypothetical protein
MDREWKSLIQNFDCLSTCSPSPIWRYCVGVILVMQYHTTNDVKFCTQGVPLRARLLFDQKVYIRIILVMDNTCHVKGFSRQPAVPSDNDNVRHGQRSEVERGERSEDSSASDVKAAEHEQN